MKALRSLLAASALLVMAAAPDPSAADGWSGTWTLDRPRSELVGTSVRIARIPTGYHFDFGATQFDIHDDGAFSPTVPGRATSLKAINAREWVRVHRVNGMNVDRSILRITPDQKALLIDTEAVAPDGSVRNSKEMDERVGAGQGLAGTWRSIERGVNVPRTLSLQRLSDGRLRWGAPAEGNYFVVAPNGAAAVNQGARAESNVTMTLRQISPVEMRWVVMVAAKPFMEGVDTLEADGSLIETSWTDQFPDERQRAVYRR